MHIFYVYSSEAVLLSFSLLLAGTLISGIPSVFLRHCTPVHEGRQTVRSLTWLMDVGSKGDCVLQGPK